ncbi:MAG: PRC-barrel domain-containing protein [Candidatus Competibacteraceae bacterium]
MKKALFTGAIALTLAATGAVAVDTATTNTPAAATGTGTAADPTSPGALTNGTQSIVNAIKVRASNLIGANIVNEQNQTIGKVQDLVISGSNNVMAVISVGGFLGMGEKLVAVPFEQLRISRDSDNDLKILYPASRDELRSAPSYDYHS